ncbi:serine/threonine-protein kinase [Amycolatopsis sp. YIM 10]|uniref:serine/threonine-protein kinase n=1 Tax=Amycolatopsis sp. YIM 10 TaxID=2653857 RepID=UPI0012905188|nr:serine/threonine-protein kinase [Amycolatopsis sp. YIM 10]QFU94459.1 Serine/threonine-protein kinase AfsK [Amycolatopsis sp. YIM 10]
MQPLRPDEPRQLGPYRLIAALGEGGMGRVLLGIAPDGRLVAVKQVHAQFAHDPGFRERFRREVATSRLVSGAYTAAVMDADPEAETPWLASVFVTGPSLKEAVDTAGPLPVNALRHLATGLAAALLDIHRAGLIHRDLKPSNVLLTDDGPRVIDFGIARAVEDGQELTGTGAIIGSPAFMSPEQAGTAPVTPASDVFSFGALLVMAATGRGPFTGTTTAQTLYNVVHSQPDLGALPPDVRRFVEPCLAKNPAHRPTPAQLLDFLGHLPPGTTPWPEAVHARIHRQDAEVRAVLSLPLPQWRPPPKPRPAKKRRRWIWAVSAAVLAVALVAGTVTVYRLAQSAKAARDAPPPLSIQDALTPERLLRADPCKVLDSEYTPEERPSYTYRCQYTGTKNVAFDLVLGDALQTTGIRTSPTVIDGQGVLLNDISGGCEAMVRLPTRPGSSVMIYNSSRDGDPCAIAETALTEALKRLRDPVVDRQTQPGSLLPVDPCTVLDDATAQKIAGSAVKAAPQALRRCEWATQDTLSVTLDRGYPDTEGAEVDLGGISARQNKTGSTCTLSWTHLPSGDRESDNVRLSYYSATGDNACEKANEAAKAVIPKLPKP